MIRQATVDDTPALFEMSSRFLRETVYARLAPPSDESILVLIQAVLEKGVVFVDEIEDGTIIGMIGLAALSHLLTGRLYADEIVWWVEPEHRKTRAAYRLLCAAEEWATRNGLSVLKMVAPAGSQIGTFYERRGYEAVETAYQKRLSD